MARNREIHNIRRRADRAFAREIKARIKAGATENEINSLKKGYADLRAKTLNKAIGKAPGANERREAAFARLYAFTSNVYQVRDKSDIARANMLFKSKMNRGVITGSKAVDSFLTAGFWAATRKYWMGKSEDRLGSILAGMQKSNPEIQTYQDAFKMVIGELQNNSQFDALKPYLSGLDGDVSDWDVIAGMDIPEEIISDYIKRAVVLFR